MTSASSELEELRTSLRRALGTPSASLPPTVDPNWRATWPRLAELGVTALCLMEESGGFGLHVGAAALTATELGATLHASPFAAATAAGLLLDRAVERAVFADVLHGVVSGSVVATVAVLDRGTIVGDDDTVRVQGVAGLVPAGDTVDYLVVVAPDLYSAALVHREHFRPVPSAHVLDVTRSVVDVHFDASVGTRVTVAPKSLSLAGAIGDLLLAADALGGVQRSLDRTVLYASERVAFGRPIGGFQAVQHRLVDHALRVRAMALLVGAAADDLAATGSPRRSLLAQASVARHAVHVLHDLVQLTGAIGFTWEHGLHFYERRAHLDARLARNPRRALVTLAEAWTV